MRIGEGEPQSFVSGTAVLVDDDTPWVDLGFSSEPKKKALHAACRSGSLEPCGTPPTQDLTWFRWNLFQQPDERRRGEARFGGGSSELPEVVVYVTPGRIFGEHQYQAMVEAILATFRAGTWDTRALGVFVRPAPSHEKSPPRGLIDEVSEELRAALAVARDVRHELAPTSPGHVGLPGAPDVYMTAALPENEIVGWWATKRGADLRAARTEVERRLEARRMTTRRFAPEGTRYKHIVEQIEQDQELLRGIQQLAPRVSRLVSRRASTALTLSPGITRDPRRRLLLRAFRARSELPQLAATQRLSRLRERKVSELFELWGAIALVQVVESLGWVLGAPPDVRMCGPSSSPEQVLWRFRRPTGEAIAEELILIYEPHASQPAVMPPSPTGRRVSRIHRALESARRAPLVEGLFSVGVHPSPDYVFIYRSREGLAFCCGDAKCSDVTFLATTTKKWTERVTRVARDYGWTMACLHGGLLARCSITASFLLLPGDERDWLAAVPMRETVDQNDLLLIGATPQVDPMVPPIKPQLVAQLLETLEAEARDGSTRLPVPGASADEAGAPHED